MHELARRVARAIVDYGMGNRRSVEKALERAGAIASVTGDLDELRAAEGLVLPGVGAFPLAMRNLRELGLAELIRARVEGASRCSVSASACSCCSSPQRSSSGPRAWD